MIAASSNRKGLVVGLFLATALTVSSAALAKSEGSSDKAFNDKTVSKLLDRSARRSGSGWEALPVENGEARFLLVRHGRDGVIHKLDRFDGVVVKSLLWENGELLKVAYKTSEGEKLVSEVQLWHEAGALQFDVVSTEPTKSLRLGHQHMADSSVQAAGRAWQLGSVSLATRANSGR